jgi:uncharacterized protein (DUF1697 family)
MISEPTGVPALQILLLRGVNVGGRKLVMAELRAALEKAGCRQVVTYIQSGNVVLEPPADAPGDLDGWFEGLVSDVAGFPVAVVRRSGPELARTVAVNPFPGSSGATLHVVFLASPPGPELFYPLVDVDTGDERYHLEGRDLYLRLPNGMGRAQLPLLIDRAGRRMKPPVLGTARNWNTVLKLVELAGL